MCVGTVRGINVMGLKKGQSVEHKKFGVGKVISVEGGSKFSAVFKDGVPKTFFLEDLNTYFVREELQGRYLIQGDLDSESKKLIEQFESGDPGVGRKLIEKLEMGNEFHAVIVVCGRLESIGLQLDAFLLIKKARALRKIKKSEAAIDVAAKALELSFGDTGKSVALTVHAAALTDIGLFESAIQDCEKALSLTPKSYHSRRVLGKVYVRQGKYSDADRQFSEAETLDPGSESNRIYAYSARIAELKTNGFYSEIEQIKEHIRSSWPKDCAARALREIERVLTDKWL